MHARHLDATQGRFRTIDPENHGAGGSQSWNRYAYALGDPVKLVDPDGLNPGDPFKTPELAIADAHVYIIDSGKAMAEHREYGTWIYQRDDGRFTYDEPTPGPSGSDIQWDPMGHPIPPDGSWVTTYHFHWNGYSGINDADTSHADALGVPIFYGTPPGQGQSNEGQIFNITVPGNDLRKAYKQELKFNVIRFNGRIIITVSKLHDPTLEPYRERKQRQSRRLKRVLHMRGARYLEYSLAWAQRAEFF